MSKRKRKRRLSGEIVATASKIGLIMDIVLMIVGAICVNVKNGSATLPYWMLVVAAVVTYVANFPMHMLSAIAGDKSNVGGPLSSMIDGIGISNHIAVFLVALFCAFALPFVLIAKLFALIIYRA